MSLHIKDVLAQFPMTLKEMSELLMTPISNLKNANRRQQELTVQQEKFLGKVLEVTGESDEAARSTFKDEEIQQFQKETDQYVNFELRVLRLKRQKTEKKLAKMIARQDRAARRRHHVDLLNSNLGEASQPTHVQRWLEMITLFAQLDLHTYGHLPQLRLRRKIAGFKAEIAVLEGEMESAPPGL